MIKNINNINKIIKFETGKTYFDNNNKKSSITIDEIIDDTIYFDEGYLSAEIKIVNNVETACITVYASRTYSANNI